MPHFEPVHITWIIIFAMFLSYRAWVEYLYSKYPDKNRYQPFISWKSSKPKNVKNKASL